MKIKTKKPEQPTPRSTAAFRLRRLLVALQRKFKKQKDFGVNIPGMALQQIQGGIYARLPYEELDKIIDRLMAEYGNGLYMYPFGKHIKIQDQLKTSGSPYAKSNLMPIFGCSQGAEL